jgi:hypothetical protein
MSPIFYREKNGDYLVILAERADHAGPKLYQGRAANIAGLTTSVCTCVIAQSYLDRECQVVSREDVPADWVKAMFPPAESTQCE